MKSERCASQGRGDHDARGIEDRTISGPRYLTPLFPAS